MVPNAKVPGLSLRMGAGTMTDNVDDVTVLQDDPATLNTLAFLVTRQDSARCSERGTAPSRTERVGREQLSSRCK